MEEKIMPFPVECGMVMAESWIDREKPDRYIWLRRFESKEERKEAIRAVYEDRKWGSDVNPQIDEMLDRSRFVTRQLAAPPESVMR
jgi:hypothetical protein